VPRRRGGGALGPRGTGSASASKIKKG